jgi:hypothetical protein
MRRDAAAAARPPQRHVSFIFGTWNDGVTFEKQRRRGTAKLCKYR